MSTWFGVFHADNSGRQYPRMSWDWLTIIRSHVKSISTLQLELSLGARGDFRIKPIVGLSSQ